MEKRTSELTVITQAKDLCSYVFTITQKSPKAFRFTFVSRMQNLSLDVIEKLYRANDIFVKRGDEISMAKRTAMQQEAMTDLRLLSYMAELSMTQGCILPKQYEQIAKQSFSCMNLLGAWIVGDRRRFTVHQ